MPAVALAFLWPHASRITQSAAEKEADLTPYKSPSALRFMSMTGFP